MSARELGQPTILRDAAPLTCEEIAAISHAPCAPGARRDRARQAGERPRHRRAHHEKRRARLWHHHRPRRAQRCEAGAGRAGADLAQHAAEPRLRRRRTAARIGDARHHGRAGQRHVPRLFRRQPGGDRSAGRVPQPQHQSDRAEPGLGRLHRPWRAYRPGAARHRRRRVCRPPHVGERSDRRRGFAGDRCGTEGRAVPGQRHALSCGPVLPRCRRSGAPGRLVGHHRGACRSRRSRARPTRSTRSC